MTGTDLVKTLRSKAATRRSHVVIVTALSETEIRDLRRRRKQLGVDDFLSKPLKADTIRKLREELAPSKRGAAK
jgi:CheY-like chemotaxis protein